MVGAVVSITLMFLARQNPPTLIVWLFVVWVLGPYGAFLVGHKLSRRWSTLTQKTLYASTIIATLAALIVYTHDVVSPPLTTRAFAWTLTPPVMGGGVVLTVVIAALGSRRTLNE